MKHPDVRRRPAERCDAQPQKQHYKLAQILMGIHSQAFYKRANMFMIQRLFYQWFKDYPPLRNRLSFSLYTKNDTWYHLSVRLP